MEIKPRPRLCAGSTAPTPAALPAEEAAQPPRCCLRSQRVLLAATDPKTWMSWLIPAVDLRQRNPACVSLTLLTHPSA